VDRRIKEPGRYLAFTESLVFSKQIDALGSLDLLFAIEDDLIKDPTRGLPALTVPESLA
jgi:hypothetical protein